jgi:hypothetical protein
MKRTQVDPHYVTENQENQKRPTHLPVLPYRPQLLSSTNRKLLMGAVSTREILFRLGWARRQSEISHSKIPDVSGPMQKSKEMLECK